MVVIRIAPLPETGEQLRTWRTEHHRTQKDLAALLGVSPSTVGKWERRSARLPASAQFRLSKLAPTGYQIPRPANTILPSAYSARITADVSKAFRQATGGGALTRAITSAMEVTRVLASVDLDQWTVRLVESLRPVLDRIASIQAIISAFPTQEEFKRVSSVLADRGWFLGLSSPINLIRHADLLLADGDTDRVEELMQDYVRERLDDILTAAVERCPARTTILADATAAHREGRFALSIPVLLAQADGMSAEILGGHLFRRESKKTIASKRLEETLSELNPNGWGWLTIVLAPIYDAASIGIHTAERGRRQMQDPSYGPLNRHGVLHGSDVDYGTEANSLRAFMLLEYLLSLDTVLASHESVTPGRR